MKQDHKEPSITKIVPMYHFQIEGVDGWKEDIIDEAELNKRLHELGLSEDENEFHYYALMSGAPLALPDGFTLRVKEGPTELDDLLKRRSPESQARIKNLVLDELHQPNPEFMAELEQLRQKSMLRPGEPSYGHLFNDDPTAIGHTMIMAKTGVNNPSLEAIEQDKQAQRFAIQCGFGTSLLIFIFSLVLFNYVAFETYHFVITGIFIFISAAAVGHFATKIVRGV